MEKRDVMQNKEVPKKKKKKAEVGKGKRKIYVN